MTPLDFEYLRKLLKERSGLDLTAEKQYLVESRLTPLARKAGLSGIGDLVLCYTDSLIESRGADGALLGVNGLLEAARRVEASNPTEFVHALLDAVAKLHEGNLDGDDVTVLLFRPNGMSPCVPIRDRLLAPLRILKSLARSALRGGGDGGFPEISIANIGGALFTRLNRRTGLTREP